MQWSHCGGILEHQLSYDQLVPIKRKFDERKHEFYDKMNVVGRVIDQLLDVVYIPLKKMLTCWLYLPRDRRLQHQFFMNEKDRECLPSYLANS